MLKYCLHRRWIFLGYGLIGLVVAISSSLPILDPLDPLHANDEGFYLRNGLQASISLDLRYGLFSALVYSYFLLIKNPFLVVILHKVAMLGVFFMFAPILVARRGMLVFSLLFSAFVFLNSFFLRDSLIFLLVLFAILQNGSDRSVRNALPLVPLMLTRPQTLLLFLRPWVSFALLLCFLTFMRGQYATSQLRDNGHLTLIHQPFWSDVLSRWPATLSNLNPLVAIEFYVDQHNYIIPPLLIVASMPMFIVFFVMISAIFLKNYRNHFMGRLWVGFFGMLVIYGSIGEVIDRRVFISLFSPFLVGVGPLLFRCRNFVFLVVAWVIMFCLRDALRGRHIW